MDAMRLLTIACALVALAGVLASSAVAATPLRATMKTSSTRPLADAPWRYTIVVNDRRGRPVRAQARLQILLGTLVVGCWRSGAMRSCSGARSGTWLAFRGERTGVISWPARFAGDRLTFRATILSAGRLLRLAAPLTVRQRA